MPSAKPPPPPPEGPLRMAEVLAALSLATDLGAGKPMGHALRACYLGLHLARELALPTAQQAELYYSFLLMHSGCTALSLALAPLVRGDELAAIADATLRDDANPLDLLAWMRHAVSPGAPLPARAVNLVRMALHSQEAAAAQRGTCEVAVRVARRLGMPPGVQAAVQSYLERWDGRGPYGLRGSAIPLSARLLQAALKIEAFHAARGRGELDAWLRQQAGKSFDPQVIEAFQAVASRPQVWETLAQGDLWAVVLELEPASPFRSLAPARLDDIAYAVADFVDLKSPHSLGHSRATAQIAEAMARTLGLPAAQVDTVRRAALVHDLGQVALPGHLLHPQAQLSEADKEKVRLHPYYTERVLARVPALAEVAALAGAHHERLDGSGFYRGLAGSQLSLAARLLAVADAFHEHWRAQPDPQAALEAMRPGVGTLYAPECFEALAAALGVASAKPRRPSAWPNGLTQREVEVLRLVARGHSNRAVAKQLVISEKTVGHHLEHIYNKLGVSNRAAAVFFAMEHELLS